MHKHNLLLHAQCMCKLLELNMLHPNSKDRLTHYEIRQCIEFSGTLLTFPLSLLAHGEAGTRAGNQFLELLCIG